MLILEVDLYVHVVNGLRTSLECLIGVSGEKHLVVLLLANGAFLLAYLHSLLQNAPPASDVMAALSDGIDVDVFKANSALLVIRLLPLFS